VLIVVLAVVVAGALKVGLLWIDAREAVPKVEVKKKAVKKAKKRLPDWDASRPIFVDVNGDGVKDLVGRLKGPVLAALDGRDYRLLWKSGLLNKDTIAYLAPKKRLLLATSGKRILALALADGKRIWTGALPYNVREIHQWEGGGVMVDTTQGWMSLDLNTGRSTPKGEPQKSAFRLMKDRGHLRVASSFCTATNPHRDSPYPVTDLHVEPWRRLTRVSAFCPWQSVSHISTKGRISISGDRAYCHFPRGLACAVGYTKGGWAPFLVGFDVNTRKILWQRQMTPGGPIDRLAKVPRADLLGDRALLTYRMQRGGQQIMELVSTTDGKVLWSIKLSYSNFRYLVSAVLTETKVFVTYNNEHKLMVHDARDGRLLGKVAD